MWHALYRLLSSAVLGTARLDDRCVSQKAELITVPGSISFALKDLEGRERPF